MLTTSCLKLGKEGVFGTLLLVVNGDKSPLVRTSNISCGISKGHRFILQAG